MFERSDPEFDVKTGVSLIIVTYFTGEDIFTCLDHALSDPLTCEIILIDNGSNDHDVRRFKALEAKYPQLIYVSGHGNIGFGKAVNLGATYARFDYIAILNPDAFLQKDTLSHLIDAHPLGQSPCIVGARIMNTDGTEQRGGRRGEISPVTTLVSLLRLKRFLPILSRYEMHLHDQPLPDAPVAMPTISGACFLMLRQDFAKMNGFDPAFFLHVEDVELCWRARKMGGSVIFQPKAEVIHVGHTSLVDPVFVEKHKGRGLIYFFNKRSDTLWRKIYLLFLTPLIVAVSWLRAVGRSKRH